MKKNLSFYPPNCLVSFAILLLLISCNPSKDQPERENTNMQETELNLPAMYTGILPCADCPGINYQLILESEQFIEFSQYQDQSLTKFKETGIWEINGDTLTLRGLENLILKRFLLRNGNFTLLDRNNQKVTGGLAEFYVLERTGDQEPIREHHQKLAEQGFKFFAAGNEPFWSLKIDSLNQLIFESPERELNLGRTDLSEIKNEMQFQTSSDSIQVAVYTRKKYCQDSMSGYLFPQTVTAVLQTTNVVTLRGCGLFLDR